MSSRLALAPNSRRAFAALTLVASFMVGCEKGVVAGGPPPVAVDDGDPLAITDIPEQNSLDDIYLRVISRSCSGQAGLCHNGQFEPNLSSAALAYENLVLRPSLEHPNQQRVSPGHGDRSLLIDKLRNQNVISQMPLGAKPLAEEDIAAISAWIDGGALRKPGADPAPVLDNPPEEPAVAVFDDTGNRIDMSGSAKLEPGKTVTFRMTVKDFETADQDVPAAFFLLQTDVGQSLVVAPDDSVNGPTAGTALFDGGQVPNDKGEPLDWAWTYVVPATADMYDVDGTLKKDVPLSGITFSVIAGYYDGTLQKPGALAIGIAADLVKVAP